MIFRLINYIKILISNFSFFFTASTISYFLVFFQNLVVIKLIDPSELGIWNILIIFYTLGLQLHLGILNSLNKFLPKLKKNNFSVKALELINPALFILKILFILLIIIFIIFFDVIQKIYPYGYLWIIIFISTLIFLLVNFNLAILRSSGKFTKVGKIQLSESIFTFILLPLVFFYGIDGLCYRLLFVSLFMLIYSKSNVQIKYTAIFDLETSKKLLSSGIGIMFISFFNLFMVSQDRLIIEHFFNEYYVGIFHISVIATNIVMLVPSLAGQVFYTSLMKLSKKKIFLNVSLKYLIKNSLIFMSFSLLIIIFLFFLLPPFIHLFYINYIPSISLLKITLPTALIYISCICPFYYFVNILSFKNIFCFGLITLISFLITFFLSKYFNHNDLNNIAFFQLLSALFFSISLWLLVIFNIRRGIKLNKI